MAARVEGHAVLVCSGEYISGVSPDPISDDSILIIVEYSGNS